jgi:hypothetical protein
MSNLHVVVRIETQIIEVFSLKGPRLTKGLSKIKIFLCLQPLEGKERNID